MHQSGYTRKHYSELFCITEFFCIFCRKQNTVKLIPGHTGFNAQLNFILEISRRQKSLHLKASKLRAADVGMCQESPISRITVDRIPGTALVKCTLILSLIKLISVRQSCLSFKQVFNFFRSLKPVCYFVQVKSGRFCVQV